jgi:hypothetical protein
MSRPSYLRALLDVMPTSDVTAMLADVRGVAFASEALDGWLAHRMLGLKRGIRMWNMYDGCTETTGVIAAYEVTGAEPAESRMRSVNPSITSRCGCRTPVGPRKTSGSW